MCGIAGAIGAVDPELERAVGEMTKAELHRGPDDSGTYTAPGVAFGFRRLAILDLSQDGHQPMVDRERNNAIVFDGEIYNYLELRRGLEQAGERFNSRGDTEVLLKSYGRYGERALRDLRGMFAFAVYDANKREVLLARDRLGIKPLYYAELERPGGKAVVFASELRALLATGLFRRELDPDALASYLWNGFVVGPSTMVRGIQLLAPGAWLNVSLENKPHSTGRYWSLGGRETLPEELALENLTRELATATSQHLASDVPLGVFLSGGVDSSAIAALAVQAAKSKVHTFNVSFEEAAFDESPYARRVAQALGTEHVELKLTQARFQERLGDALDGLDQPTFDAINTYFVSREVREAGFTVALAGTGGDELFGGYRSFNLPRGHKLARALRPAPAGVLSRMASVAVRAKLGVQGEVPPQTRWGKLADALLTRGDDLALYQVAYGLFTREFLSELSRVDVMARAPYGLPPERARELDELTRHSSALGAVSQRELSLFLGERLLRDSDAASMAVSLELRVPLLDHVVVEAVQAVPDHARFEPLGKKLLLRKLALSGVDPSIFDRPKSGFVLPIEVWAKDRLAPEIDAVFRDRALVESVGLQPSALSGLYRAFQSGAPGIYWSRVWAPFVLLRWCRQHGVALP